MKNQYLKINITQNTSRVRNMVKFISYDNFKLKREVK